MTDWDTDTRWAVAIIVAIVALLVVAGWRHHDGSVSPANDGGRYMRADNGVYVEHPRWDP